MTDRVERIRQALAGRYGIERELGSGGMATVYLARDLKHDRLVAMKVLHPELAASLGSERFLREIQVTAKLSHPHILPLYDSGEADGLLYYTMPFIEGESLHDFIKRERQLAIPEAVRIAREVAEGLAIAHSYGLVHRDIKPQNILLSGGHAVIADFGIATAVSQAQGEKLTQTGMSIGTPAYMSPEQAAGLEVDGRSDIYSLGCVLYEMLVGQVPFTGPTPQSIIARHTMDQITAPHIMRDTIPEELEDVIYVAMAKSPADRYRTAQEFADALMSLDSGTVPQRRLSRTMEAPRRRRGLKRPVVIAMASAAVIGAAFAGWILWPRGAAGGTARMSRDLDPRRIAVLYFDDLSSDSSMQHVADGLTEGLIEQLGGVPGLTAVSRNAAEPYRGSELSRDSVARALGTGTLIVGSVEPAGRDRIRVTTRLVDGTSGADVGRRASFVVTTTVMRSARDSVARDVSQILREWLGHEVELRERRAGAHNDAAWLLVQRAEKLRKDAQARVAAGDRAATLSLLERADSLLGEAAAADPEWIEPLVQRTETVSAQAWLHRRERSRAAGLVDTGLTLARRALEMAPNHPRALEARGALRYRAWQMDVSPDGQPPEQLLEQAYQDLDAAVRADPSLASAHATLSHLHYQRKDRVAAMLAARRAYEADAYLRNADDILARLHVVSYDLANFKEAQRWCDEGTRRFPRDRRFIDCHLWMLITPDATANADSAWHLVNQLDSLTPERSRPFLSRLSRQVVAGVLGRGGSMDSARSMLLSLRTDDPKIDPEHELQGYEAAIRTLIGDKDEAIALLKRYVVTNPHHSFERGGSIMWWWLPLRDHPEFRQLLTLQ